MFPTWIKHCFIQIVLIISLIQYLTPYAQAQSLYQNYLWPLDSPPYLSGNFAESRSGHFHSGIDIKTWGREGFRILASKDGIIEKLTLAADGYGKSVFLRHQDSSLTVYAHLATFNKKIEEAIDSLRLAQPKQTTWNISYPVKQGDVLGYSGQTGNGPPHLHFEIRYKNGDFINPLTTNLKEKIQDTRRPIIKTWLIESWDEDHNSIVNEYHINAHDNKEDTIRITAHAAGIAVETIDYANDVPNYLAPYQLKLFDSNDTLYTIDYPLLSQEQLNRLAIEHSPTMLLQHKRTFRRLYKSHYLGLKKTKYLKTNGWLYPRDEPYQLVVQSIDIMGNQTEKKLILYLSSPKIPDPSPNPPNSNNIAALTNPLYFYFSKHIRLATDQQSHTIYTFPSYNNPLLQLQKIYRDKSYELTLLPKPIQLTFGAYSLFHNTYLLLGYTTQDDRLFIHIGELSIPLQKPFNITISYLNFPFLSKQHACFRKKPQTKRLEYITTHNNLQTLHCEVDHLGTVIIMPDTTKPLIYPPELKKDLLNRPIIEWKYYEEESGISIKSIDITVDKTRGIIEIDPERSIITYRHPNITFHNNMETAIRLSDNTNNQSTLVTKIDVSIPD